MRGRDLFGICLTSAVIGLDQITKWIVDQEMVLHESIPVIPGFLNMTYVRNTGVAFGLLSSPDPGLRSILLLLFSLVAIAVILIFWFKSRQAHLLLIAALGMILGGAIGNLIDRFRLGEVIDFIDIYWKDLHWPAFNIADSAITIGVILLLFHLIFQSDTSSPKTNHTP